MFDHFHFKGTVSVSSMQRWIAKFTMVPLKPLYDKYCGRFCLFLLKSDWFCKLLNVVLQ